MVFEIDPDKPNIPALARILWGMSMLLLIGSILSLLLAFSGYIWVNENYALAGAIGAFFLGLMFAGQAKILELLAVVSARVRSRFAIDALAKHSAMPAVEKKPVTSATGAVAKERVIHVPDEQARQQGFKVR